MDMDYTLYKTINGLSGAALPDRVLTFLAQDLPAIIVVLVALAFLVPWARRRTERRAGAVLATASAALSLGLNQPLAHLVERARPYLAHPAHAHLLIARSHDPSFPSDHATGAFALAFGIWLYDRTIGTILLVLATVLSFARVYVGTHYPGDVLAGALIGAAAAALLYLLAPSRQSLQAISRRCGTVWDAVTHRVVRRPTLGSPQRSGIRRARRWSR
jgi:membrane-associated phospholipid phosphatase